MALARADGRRRGWPVPAQGMAVCVPLIVVAAGTAAAVTGGTASCGIRRREGVPVGVEPNHTIVRVRDKRQLAQLLTEIPGLGDPWPFGPFLIVQAGNDVSPDFADDHGSVICGMRRA